MVFSFVCKTGERVLSPRINQTTLEGGWDIEATIHFVGFATVALAAELRGLVRSGGSGSRVVGGAHEEHRLVVARRQAGLAGTDFHHVHEVLVVASRALHGRLTVVSFGADKEAVV